MRGGDYVITVRTTITERRVSVRPTAGLPIVGDIAKRAKIAMNHKTHMPSLMTAIPMNSLPSHSSLLLINKFQPSYGYLLSPGPVVYLHINHPLEQ